MCEALSLSSCTADKGPCPAGSRWPVTHLSHLMGTGLGGQAVWGSPLQCPGIWKWAVRGAWACFPHAVGFGGRPREGLACELQGGHRKGCGLRGPVRPPPHCQSPRPFAENWLRPGNLCLTPAPTRGPAGAAPAPSGTDPDALSPAASSLPPTSALSRPGLSPRLCHLDRASPWRMTEEERCTQIYTGFIIFRRVSPCPRSQEAATGLTPWVLQTPSSPPVGPS